MVTRRRLFSVLLVGILAAGTNSYLVAADLDAPLVKKPPTLRTEIKRGKVVATECAAVLDLGSHDRCLSKIESALRLKNELNEPFELGFNLWGLLSFDLVYSVAAEMNKLASRDVDYAKVTQSARYRKIKELQRTLNLSDDDLCEALLKGAPEKCRQLIARWSVPVQ